MDWRNRIGLYGSYFLGMAAIGFTLAVPAALPRREGARRTGRSGSISTLAALSGLAQFPVGLWSDRIGWRKPFLVVALAVVAAATWLLRGAHGVGLARLPRRPVRRERHLPRGRRKPLRGRGGRAGPAGRASARPSGPCASGSRSASSLVALRGKLDRRSGTASARS